MVIPRRPAERPDEPKRPARRLRRPWRAVIVCAGAVVLAWGTGALAAQYARTYALANQAARLDQHRRALIAENQGLRDEIQRLRTDDGYIEWLARKDLGMVRPGEIEFLVVPAQTAGGTAGDPRDESLARAIARAARDSGAVTAPAPGAAAARPAADAGGWLGRLARGVSSFLARLHL